MMTWALMIFLWHGDAMTSQTVEMYDRRTCEIAAITVKAKFVADHGNSIARLAVICVERSQK